MKKSVTSRGVAATDFWGSLPPWVPGAAIFFGVVGLFLPATRHDFITYDDPVYVTQNDHVTGGLTWANFRWAFQSVEASNWHPLTWLSHMADCQLYGLQPGGHHLTSVLLHALNAALLFVVLRKMTASTWRSFFVAALFALHPLHVESVAWIAERKDVLSTAFMMLTIWAYGHRLQLIRAGTSGAGRFYGLALLFFALGLMSKPMLVTLPCVLLLLDYWPLNRWDESSFVKRWALLGEKIPFFALSVASGAITFIAQRKGGAVASLEDFTWPVRVSNALLAYCRYLGKCLVPQKLAVFYPNFADQAPLWKTSLAALLLVVVTVAAVTLFRRRRYVMVGWLWFLGMLVPVIGLVQTGGQTMADRYTYVPLIGIFIIATWAITDLAVAWSLRPRWLGFAGGLVLVGCAALTTRQLGFWKNNLTLFRHATAVTAENYVAHANLFIALAKTSPAEAKVELEEMKRILGSFAETFEKKGIALAQIPGREEEAIKEFRTAIRIMRDIPGPHFNLGVMLARRPDLRAEAIEELRAALRLRHDFADAHYSLALLLSEIRGRESESIYEYQTAIHFNPGSYQAHFNLGLLLMDIPGRKNEALDHFQSALSARPDLVQAREMIARLQAVGP